MSLQIKPLSFSYEVKTIWVVASGLFSALVFVLTTGLVYRDIRYGLALDLDRFGLLELKIFLQTMPWFGIALSVVSIYVFVFMALTFVKNIPGVWTRSPAYSRKVLLLFICVPLSVFATTSLFTRIDNTIISNTFLSNLRTFRNFVNNHILEGEIVFVDQEKIVVRDEEGDDIVVYIEDEARDSVVGQSVSVGDKVAFYVNESVKEIKKKIDNPITIARSSEDSSSVGTSYNSGDDKIIVNDPIIVNPSLPTEDDPKMVANTISIVLHGRTGDETMSLFHNNTKLVTWQIGTSPKTYSFTYSATSLIAAKDFKFNYDNDIRVSASYDRNIEVGYAVINGISYDATAANTFISGYWNGANCVDGYLRVNIIECSGYVIFGEPTLQNTPSVPTPAPLQPPTPTIETSPNPVVSSPVNSGPVFNMYAAYGSTVQDMYNFNSNIAKVDGFFRFTHLGWPAEPPNKWSPGVYTNVKQQMNVKHIESTLQLATWNIDYLSSGSRIPNDAQAWLLGYFSEADSWLSTYTDVRLTVRLMHEMNLDWTHNAGVGGGAASWYIGAYPNDTKSASYVEAWRRIYNLVENSMTNKDRIDWLWSPNMWWVNYDKDPRNAYPGDAYVDKVGISWYSSAGLTRPLRGSADWALEKALENIKSIAPGKPFGLGEFGVGQISDRVSFWRDFFSVLDEKNVDFVNYFYVAAKPGEENWTMLNPVPGEIEAFKDGYSRWKND